LKKLINLFQARKIKELWIIGVVAVLAISTIIYANLLANKIEKQEKSQVILWAKAISEKTRILKISNELFQELTDEERKKLEITKKTSKLIQTETDNEKLQLFLQILTLNDKIPAISTDENLVVLETKNLDNQNIPIGSVLSRKSNPEFFRFPPIEVPLSDKKNYIYYRESIIYQKLTKIIQESSNQFVDEITNNSSLLPVILLDKKGKLLDYGNIAPDIVQDKHKLAAYVKELMLSQSPIVIDIDPQNKKFLYYENSNIASYIKWFPIGLYTILATLLFLTFSAIRTARNFEKNQIWVGMSKETAHQLGTPISSLGAWIEVIEESSSNLHENQKNVLGEMKKDINRLSLIADRFSKIGSKPKLESIQLDEILHQCYDYLRKRASKKIQFSLENVDKGIYIEINRQLFEWVIENLVKNAFDAIGHEGKVSIKTSVEGAKVFIDIKDSGKGILPKDEEHIFEPGFTTKKRGWGLGLSLCKRIIEDYFGGKIYVQWSKINSGTIIRIELKKKLGD